MEWAWPHTRCAVVLHRHCTCTAFFHTAAANVPLKLKDYRYFPSGVPLLSGPSWAVDFTCMVLCQFAWKRTVCRGQYILSCAFHALGYTAPLQWAREIIQLYFKHHQVIHSLAVGEIIYSRTSNNSGVPLLCGGLWA